MREIDIYDATPREGGQAVTLNSDKKLKLLEKDDEAGVPRMEGGWPDKPGDAKFFKMASTLHFPRTQLVGFGMTAKVGEKPENSRSLNGLIEGRTEWVAIVGKASLWQVTEILGTTGDVYLETISESVEYLRDHGLRVVFDAEHFFDGYFSDPNYALKVILKAKEAGAEEIALCDTNGWNTPDKIKKAVRAAKRQVGSTRLAIHAHNDRDFATINAFWAVEGGADGVQTTWNGIGERTGNTNLSTIVANLILAGYKVKGIIPDKLTEMAHFVADVTETPLPTNTPIVGESAGEHNAGLHADAVLKNPNSYEAFDITQFGNKRRIVNSEQGGKGNILATAKRLNFGELSKNDPRVSQLLKETEGLESKLADVQEFLLYNKYFSDDNETFEIERGTHSIKSWNENAQTILKLKIDGDSKSTIKTADSKHGSLNAFDIALKEALRERYPEVDQIKLLNHEVHKLWTGGEGTAATVKVIIEFSTNGDMWTSKVLGVDQQEASEQALVDAYKYWILKSRVYIPT